ncbi:MAG: DUF1850 domain-containing protein [Clostridia bacterium]|nr:DUF1850 domain-containing protein [Clostridia bacterium]
MRSRNLLFTAGVLAAAALLALAMAPRSYRLVLLAGGGRILYSSAVEPGDTFQMEFTHSVARTPVIEKFILTENGKIKLYETAYHDFGAGLPTEPGEGERMILEPDAIRIVGMSREFDRIAFRVGGIARHRFSCKGQVIDLASVVEPGSEVDLGVEAARRLPLFIRGY